MTLTVKPNRSSSYVFTVTDRNDPHLKSFRESVSIANALRGPFDRPQYVKLQARGHRLGVRRYNQSLPLEFGTHFDVYVYER